MKLLLAMFVALSIPAFAQDGLEKMMAAREEAREMLLRNSTPPRGLVGKTPEDRQRWSQTSTCYRLSSQYTRAFLETDSLVEQGLRGKAPMERVEVYAERRYKMITASMKKFRC